MCKSVCARESECMSVCMCTYMHIHTSPDVCERDSLPGCVFKEAIVGTEHLMREKEEPFPGQTAIVQARFPCKPHIQSAVEVGEWGGVSNSSETVLKDLLATDWQLQEVWDARLEGV